MKRISNRRDRGVERLAKIETSITELANNDQPALDNIFKPSLPRQSAT